MTAAPAPQPHGHSFSSDMRCWRCGAGYRERYDAECHAAPVSQRQRPLRLPSKHKLRRWRMKLGLSQAALEARAGLANGTVCHIESGYAKGPPRPRTRTLILSALELPAARCRDIFGCSL